VRSRLEHLRCQNPDVAVLADEIDELRQRGLRVAGQQLSLNAQPMKYAPPPATLAARRSDTSRA
jgi:hypothetical protein